MTEKKNALLDFLGSTRLTIFLFIFLLLGSVLGTIIIQESTSEGMHIPEVYSPVIIKIFRGLGFFDIYHSPMYVGLLILLVMNLLVCTSRRIKMDRRRLAQEKDRKFPEKLDRFKHGFTMRLNGRVEEVRNRVNETVRKLGYRLRAWDDNRISGNRGRLKIYGFYLAHMGTLIIIIGGMISGLLTIEGILWLMPGDSSDKFRTYDGEVVELGYTVRCDDFFIEYYPSGMVSEYKSELTVIEGDQEILEKTLIVNSPLSHGKFRLYQSQYRAIGVRGIHLKVSFDSGEQKDVLIPSPGQGKLVAPDGDNMTFTVLQFEPDFVFDSNMKASSRSTDLNNPAFHLQVEKGGETSKPKWFFIKHQSHHGGGEEGYQIEVKDLEPNYATGIEVSRDIGSVFIWIGSIIMITGLIITFFVFRETLWITIDSHDKGSRIVVAGVSPKNPMGLKLRIDRLQKSLMPEDQNG